MGSEVWVTQASTLASSLATKESGTEGKPLLWEVEMHCVFWDYVFEIDDDDDSNCWHWKHTRDRNCSKCFACHALILLVTQWASNCYHPQFHRSVPDQLSNLPKVTQLVSERTRIRTREGRLQGLMRALRFPLYREQRARSTEELGSR